jgi:hypothetical protein
MTESCSGQQNVDLPPVATTVELVVEVALMPSRVCVRGGKLGLSAGPRTERRSVVIAPRRINAEALAVRLCARGACPVSTGITDSHGRHCKRRRDSLRHPAVRLSVRSLERRRASSAQASAARPHVAADLAAVRSQADVLLRTIGVLRCNHRLPTPQPWERRPCQPAASTAAACQ